MNQGWIYRDQVKPCDAGLTLLQFYSQRYPHSTGEEWQERIALGQVLLQDQAVLADTILQQGQWLSYHRPPWQEPEVPLQFEVLVEDADLLVVSKPAGLPVLPGGGFLQHTLLGQLQRQYPDAAPVPIHRLGRGTSGLLLLARSALARAHLSQQMRQRQIRKTYRALTQAGDVADQFTITQPIGKVAYPGLGYVYAATEVGLEACSEGQVLQRRSEALLVSMTILTGRPHQIRIHCAAAGIPLVGDPLYGVGGVPLPREKGSGKLAVPGDCGYRLHAYSLSFQHPRNGDEMSVVCPPPVDLCPIKKRPQ
jgi:23S rRNA pseudouridine1911/1915/1917 synthase